MILFVLCMIAILIFLFLLWCILLLPRKSHPGLREISSVRYAHRGLHNIKKGIPENSITAFRLAQEHGLGAELDVHLLADGSLAVIHDSSLKRVCGKDKTIESLTAKDLKKYHLMGTKETIPLLRDVLDLFQEGPPLMIELKAANGNAAALTDAVMALLENWKGAYCIESFHPLVLLRLKKKYPAVIRGQLSQNFLRDREAGAYSWPTRVILSGLLTTCLTRPDFISYQYQDRKCKSLRVMKFLYGVCEAGWTVRDPDVLQALEQDGVIPIFEGFLPDNPHYVWENLPGKSHYTWEKQL